LDYDLDGWEDLLTANGHIMDDIHEYDKKLTYAQPALLFHNEGNGKFASISSDMAPDLFIPLVGRGLASADIDNDGDLDVLITRTMGHLTCCEMIALFATTGFKSQPWALRVTETGAGTLCSLRRGNQCRRKP
jgi:hypothetical protein